MQVDVEQIRLAIGVPYEVLVPDLLGQCATHRVRRPLFALGSSSRRFAVVLASHMSRRQYQCMDESSGVGVLDKSVAVLSALEAGPASLATLVVLTGLPRPTAHRLAVALERHRLLSRDTEGRFVLGPRLAELAAAGVEDRLIAASGPVLAKLRDSTGESTQLYRRQGDVRICVAAAELMAGLRNTVPVGTRLPLTAGSAAQVLLAWEGADRMHRGVAAAVFSAQTLARVRRQGWAASVA
jgi:DNA-binding IclR family transcriptional regulator